MRLITTLAALLLLVACAGATLNTPGITRQAVMEEQRIQQQLAQQKDTTPDTLKRNRATVKRVANRIFTKGRPVCDYLTRGKDLSCVYDVEIEKSDKVNAYADGQKVALTTGMLAFTRTEEELAFIIGHEYAHNILDHISAKKQNVLLGAVVGLALEGLAQSQGLNTRGNIAKTGAQLGSLSYSKSFEAEADYVGLYIMEHAGYNISKAPDIWRRMSIRDERGIYLGSTHPTNPERFVAMQQTIDEIQAKKRTGEPLYPNIKPE